MTRTVEDGSDSDNGRLQTLNVENQRMHFVAAVHNPHGRPLAELPVIYGFCNGGAPGWWYGCLIAEDGTDLGGHLCSNEFYMIDDLGIRVGSRSDRHEEFRAHYPSGYRMEFVSYEKVKGHGGLQVAFGRAKV